MPRRPDKRLIVLLLVFAALVTAPLVWGAMLAVGR